MDLATLSLELDAPGDPSFSVVALPILNGGPSHFHRLAEFGSVRSVTSYRGQHSRNLSVDALQKAARSKSAGPGFVEGKDEQCGLLTADQTLPNSLRRAVSSGGQSAFEASSDSIDSMATLTIRQLDEKTKIRLRVRAAHHGRSMEEEAREILRSVLRASSPAKGNLAEAVRQRFAQFGGVELELPRRDALRQPPDLANDHPRH